MSQNAGLYDKRFAAISFAHLFWPRGGPHQCLTIGSDLRNNLANL